MYIRDFLLFAIVVKFFSDVFGRSSNSRKLIFKSGKDLQYLEILKLFIKSSFFNEKIKKFHHW